MSDAGSVTPHVSAAAFRCAHRLVIIITLLCCAVTAQAQVQPLEIYRQGIQSMLDNIVPNLMDTLTLKERAQLGGFRIEVTGSNDLQQSRLPSDRVSGSISAGFVSLQDVLIEAAIIDALDQHADELLGYTLDAIQYGLAASQSSKSPVPTPFWIRIGWQDARYQQLRRTPGYDGNRYRAMQQSLAWMTSVMMSERLATPPIASNDKARATGVYKKAASLMIRGGLAPTPPWPTIILYAASKQKTRSALSAGSWMCEARTILNVSVEVAEHRDADMSVSELRYQQRMSDEWHHISSLLDTRNRCALGDP